MPVIIEPVTAPNSHDQIDLLKIFNDAPDWLKQAETPEDWLTRVLADEQTLIYAGRFNDRLIAAALITPSDQIWSLDWLVVRLVTRMRGVGKRVSDVLYEIAKEHGASLTIPTTTEGKIPSWLQALKNNHTVFPQPRLLLLSSVIARKSNEDIDDGKKFADTIE